MKSESPKEYPSFSQRRILWLAITGSSLAILGALSIGGIWLSGQLLAYLQPILVPLATAGIIAYILEPLVALMERKGIGRTRSIVFIYLSTFLVLSIFLGVQISVFQKEVIENQNKTVSVPTLIEQVSGASGLPLSAESTIGAEVSIESAPSDGLNDKLTGFIINLLPKEVGHYGYIDEIIHPGIEYLRNNAETIAVNILAFLNRGANEFFGWFGFALGFIMVPVYLFFFLREAQNIKLNWHKVLPLRDSRLKTEIVETLTEINTYLAAFFRGQVLVSLIDGLIVGLALKMFGHPYGLALGALLAILGVIPIIGNLICWVPALVSGYQHYSIPENQFWLGDQVWPYLVMILAIFIIVQNINSIFTQPKIVGDSVGLHPMTVIFSILFWSLILGGFLGALLAVPLTAAIKVLLVRYVWTNQIKPQIETEAEEVELLNATEST